MERCDGEGILFFFFFQFHVLNMCTRGDKTLVTWRSQWMCMNTEIFSWTQRRKFVSSLTKLRWKPAIYRNVIQARIYRGVRSSKHKSQGGLFLMKGNKSTNKNDLETVTNKQKWLGSRGLTPIHYPLSCAANLIDKEQHPPPSEKRNTSLWAVGLLFITSRDVPPPCNM